MENSKLKEIKELWNEEVEWYFSDDDYGVSLYDIVKPFRKRLLEILEDVS